ncbi:MAG TPA: O-antigen ligase family protein [Vicinamibacterales bacterium]
MEERRFVPRASYAAVLAVVVWGTLSFGAVYPWAYKPLAVGCALVGLTGLTLGRRHRPPIIALAAAFALFAAAVVVQLIPLSREQLSQVSPSTIAFLSRFSFAFIVADSAHPISIAPDKTLLGLLLLIALALFLLGNARLMSRFGAQPIVLGLICFGGALAVFGIVQEAVNLTEEHTILVYGFWKPQYLGSRPFGPFINRNHFAGWIVMTLPVALGYLYATIEKTWRGAGRENRVGLLASSIGGRLLLLLFACAIMFMSALMTRSRSGIAAVGVVALLAGSTVVLKQATMRARLLSASLFVLIVGATVAWAGGQTIMGRALQADSNNSSIGGRIPIWRDALTIIRDFSPWGSGLDTYGTATLVYQTTPLEIHFQEAHNDYLQLAAEGGYLLGVPIVILVGIFIRDVRRRFRESPKEGMTYWLRVGAVMGLLSIAAQALVEFSLQMPGNAALFALVAAIALHQSPNLRDRSTSA